MVKINGKLLEAEGKTLTEYLEGAGYQIPRVAVEKMEKLCQRQSIPTRFLKMETALK